MEHVLAVGRLDISIAVFYKKVMPNANFHLHKKRTLEIYVL